MIDCREASNLITGSVDGELGEEDERLLADHLDGCARCRERLAFERDVLRLLRGRRVLVPLPERVRRRIVDAVTHSSEPPRRHLWPPLAVLLKPLVMSLMSVLMATLCAALAQRLTTGRQTGAEPRHPQHGAGVSYGTNERF